MHSYYGVDVKTFLHEDKLSAGGDQSEKLDPDETYPSIAKREWNDNLAKYAVLVSNNFSYIAGVLRTSMKTRAHTNTLYFALYFGLWYRCSTL